MPQPRRTTNSIATLEEQNLFLRIMAERGSTSSTSSKSENGGSKSKSSKKKATGSGANKDTRTELAPSAADKEVTVEDGAQGPVAGGDLEQGQGSIDVTSQSVPNLQASFPQPFPMQPFQPFPYMMPQQGFYPQMGHYAGFGAQFAVPEEDAWEAESHASSGAAAPSLVHGREHEISDDEDSEPMAQVVPQEGKPEVDFGSLKPGKMAELLRAQHKKAHEADRKAEPVHSAMAGIVNDFAEETKMTGEMEKLAKEFPPVKNLNKVMVPKLEPEIFTAIDMTVRSADVAMQNVQRALVAAISAIAPVGDFFLKRGEDDEELGTYSENLLSSIHLLVLANNALSARRREALRPNMQATYAKSLGKLQEGPSNWLFGGNLSEATRKCEVAKKLAEKVMKRKPGNNGQGQGQNHNNRQGAYGGQQPKRFKQNTGWQNKQQFAPKGFGYQMMHYPATPQQFQFQAPQQHQGFRPKGQQQGKAQGHQGQDFQPRGNRK